MDLSIIIPSYNRPDLLSRLLSSLEAAKKPGLDWEVIVVDNNSSHDVFPGLRKTAQSFALPLRHIVEPVAGKSRAVNLAIKESKGKYVAFLDHDVIVHQDYLAGLSKTIAAFSCNVFGGRVLPIWPSPPPDWVTGHQPLRTSRGPIVVHDYGTNPRTYDATMRLPVGCNFICRRTLFERYGFFDTHLGPGAGKGHMGGEEQELVSRFKAGGEVIFYAPWVTVDHPVEPERMTKRYFRFRVFCAGRSAPYVGKAVFPTIFGVPRYLYRKLATTAVNNLLALFTRDSVAKFERQLELCELLGSIYEFGRLGLGRRET